MEPPRSIPTELRDTYTLNNTIPVLDWYINGSIQTDSNIWSNPYIQSFIDRFTADKIKACAHGHEDYPGAALWHVNVCEKYIDAIKDKNIAVIGSIDPWIEAILVNAGAKSVTTVEFNVPVCDHPVIKTISYDDFTKSTYEYDSVFSYSSVEHAGLGRYGDPLNPTGDIETMEHIYRSLKVGGYCFVGFPVGKDAVVWNAHRIYGEKRLPMMYLDKFKEIEWIGLDKNYIYTTPLQNNGPNPIIILQK